MFILQLINLERDIVDRLDHRNHSNKAAQSYYFSRDVLKPITSLKEPFSN
jgi:hypothetical protein